MSTDSTSQAALAVQAVYAIANDPENWDLLLAALDNAPEPEPERQRELAVLVAGSAQLAEMSKARATPDARDTAGVAIVSRGGRLLAANPAVTSMHLQSMGIAGQDSGDANRDALRDATRKLETADGPVIVKLGSEADPHFVYAVAATDLAGPLLASLPPHKNEAGALALIIPAQQDTDRFWTGLRDSFGLTRAEIRLTSLLKDGLSLKDAAGELDLSVNTVRNQLGSVFAKMGLNRQSDLIRSLTQLAALSKSLPASDGDAVPNAIHPERQFLTLPDGRKLAWREYGRADGRPALIFHAGLGASRLFDNTLSVIHRLNLRLIVPERAGAGFSDPDPNFGFASVAHDTAQLCDHLKLEHFAIMALTSGARFALAAALELGNRVSRILLISPRIPMKRDEDGVTSPMVLFQRRVSANLWLLDSVFSIMRMRLSRPLISRIVHASATSPGDAAYLRDHPELVDMFVTMLKESLAVSSKGTTDEMKVLRLGNDPDLASLRAPVTVWHGAEDTYAEAADIAAYLAPTSPQMRVVPGIGNYLIHKHWAEILGWMSNANR